MASLQVSFHAPLAKDIAHTSQKSRAVKGRKQNELDMDVDDHAMDIDSMIEGAAKSAEKKNTGSAHVVTPGEVITSDSAFMRGHGTYVEQEKVLSSVAGVVERVNKLISVKPLNTRYTGEIGDVVVGRITEVSQKRWKVDVNGRQDAILMLSSINLPGGVQRRKQEADELQMRNFFREGDLLVAEVQAFFGDGAYSLHTRSLKYGKLRNGSFVSVPPSLVQRCKSHFHSLSCGVDLILGLNGYIWVSAHVSQNLDEIDTEQVYSSKNMETITVVDRETIARVVSSIRALAAEYVSINDSIVSFAYEASLQYSIKDLSRRDIMQSIANEAVSAMDNIRG